MIIRELHQSDCCALSELITKIESTLPNKEFWLPLDEVSREHFFDKDWTLFYGAFEGDSLIGASALFLNEHEFGESLAHVACDLSTGKVAEIGRAMVSPKYRGNNILLRINKVLLQRAQELDKTHIIATVHPNNTPSHKSLERLGMQQVVSYTKKCGYVRDVMLMKLKGC